MSDIRTELSKKNPYYLSKYRYLELKYFCLQYKEYKDEYRDCVRRSSEGGGQVEYSDPTGNTVVKRDCLLHKIKSIEDCAILAGEDLASYILMSVTNDLTYSNLRLMHDIPCGKNQFYDKRHKFFWILSRKFSSVL